MFWSVGSVTAESMPKAPDETPRFLLRHIRSHTDTVAAPMRAELTAVFFALIKQLVRAHTSSTYRMPSVVQMHLAAV